MTQFAYHKISLPFLNKLLFKTQTVFRLNSSLMLLHSHFKWYWSETWSFARCHMSQKKESARLCACMRRKESETCQTLRLSPSITYSFTMYLNVRIILYHSLLLSAKNIMSNRLLYLKTDSTVMVNEVIRNEMRDCQDLVLQLILNYFRFAFNNNMSEYELIIRMQISLFGCDCVFIELSWSSRKSLHFVLTLSCFFLQTKQINQTRIWIRLVLSSNENVRFMRHSPRTQNAF